jgi:hypothetical protein
MEKPIIVEQSKTPQVEPKGVVVIPVAVYAGLAVSVGAIYNYAVAVNLGLAANAAIGFNVWKAVNISK